MAATKLSREEIENILPFSSTNSRTVPKARQLSVT